MSNYEVGVRLTADGRGLVSETNAAKQALGGLSGEQRKASSDSATYTSQIERQNTSLAGLKTGLIAAAGAYVSFNAAIAGGKAVIDAALAQERLNNTLKVGLGSQQAATQEIKFLREESDKLGLQFSTTAQQYAKLTAASKGTELQGQATRDIFLSIAKASTVMGLSADQTGGALLAIEQIISKGTVSAEELRGQLGERLPGAFQIAARAMDVTTQELGEMLQRGEVLAEDLLPKLAAELERTYGAEEQNAAQGLNAQINRLDNSFTDLKLAVGQTGIIELFSDGIQIATQFVGKVAEVAKVVSSIPGVKTVSSAAFGGGVLSLIFGKDANAATAEISQATQALEQAEAVIDRITRPGAKPEVPKEFAQALKQEAAERKKLADAAIREAQRTAKAEEQEAQRRVDSAQRVINALIRETEEIGKNAVQKRLMAAAAEAATAPTKELAAEIMASAQAWAQATQAQEESLALQKEQQEAADRRAKAEIEAARQVQQEWNQMWSTVENTARTSFIQFAAHGKDAIESIGRSIQNGIIDVLYQLAVRPWIINVGTNLLGAGGGVSGGSGSNALSAANVGATALNLFGTGLGATSLVGSGISSLGSFVGSPSLAAFGGGFGGDALAGLAAGGFTSGAASAASLGAGVAAAAGPAIALLAVDQIGKFLANGRTTGTFVDKIPVIGGLAGALFGRKPFKADRQDLVGTITAGGFEGVFNDSYKAKGSLFRGSRRDNIIVDTDTGALLNQYGRLSESGISGQLSQYIDPAIERAKQLGSVLDESITTTAESLRSVAKTLDISTESLDNFSLSVDLVSEKGKQLDDAQIAQVIADAAEQMATGLIPEIGNLANRGESAVQTIARLGAQFDVLTNAASVVLGKSGSDAQSLVKSFGLSDQSAFVEAAGGIQTLSQGIEQFFNNLDDSDKLPILEDRLRGILKTVGVDFIPTMDQFNAAMQSGKLSAEQYVTALNPVTQTLIKQIDDLTKKEPELAKPREVSVKVAEKAARRQKAEAEKYQAEMEAIKAVKAEAESMRDTFLHAGDASVAVMNELKIIGESLQFTTADAFNAGLARQIADASQIVANRASTSALRIPDVGQFMSELLRNITADSVVKPIYMSIRNAIVDGSGDMSNAVRDSVNGFAQTVAREQARISRAPRATGIAAVMSAESDLSFARASGFVGGQIQFGRDVIAYGQAIENLNRRLNGGQITADEYAGAVSEIDRVMGANAKLLGDTEAQLRRINEASLALAFAGLDSIGFYFGDIAKQTAELNKKSSESGAAISKTTEAIGRLNSVSTVFSRSAAAVSDGISGAGSLAQSLQGSQAVGKAGQALLIAEAASIATQVLTTADAAQAAKKLAQDSAFENVSSAGLRDISLLLDGLNAFDAVSFENAFLRINNALISGSVTQEQYNVLFNTALDTFEGLNDSAGGAKSALGQLRDAARSAADELLLDRELSTLSSNKSLTEAQRQFGAILNRARSGDADAAGGLLGSARDLLGIARGSVSTQADYNVLFGRTVNQLRSIETIGPSRSQRLDVQPVVDELKLLRAEVEKLRLQNNTNSKATSRNTKKTRKQLQSWDANGLPATET